MMTKSLRNLAVKLLFLSLLSTLSLYAQTPQNSEQTILTDAIGREVSVNLPAKRIILGAYYLDFLAVSGDQGFENVVAFSKSVWEETMPPTDWKRLEKLIPSFNKLQDIGDINATTFQTAQLLELKPDLIILANWQFQALGSHIDQIQKAQIPIVVIDYHQYNPVQYIKNTQLLGRILNQQNRAQALSDFYMQTITDVRERITAANLPAPKIYIEFGNVGPQQMGVTYSDDSWGHIINLAYGQNIADPTIDQQGIIEPDQILLSKPDVIIIVGNEETLSKNRYSMAMGVNVPADEARRRLAGYKKRPGWGDLPAIKKNQLFGVYQYASSTLANAAMVQYIAKVLYPELFKDIDATKTYVNFYKQFLPIMPNGTFAVQSY